jgi:hypothetical protein
LKGVCSVSQYPINTLYQASIRAYQDLNLNQADELINLPKSNREAAMETMIKSDFGRQEVLNYKKLNNEQK